MSAPALIRWQGLLVQPAADGSLQQVVCDDGTPVLEGLAVRFAQDWQLQRTEFLLDEVEQHWVLEREGALQARAVVRQVFDDAWSLRVQIVNLTDVEVQVPAAWLDLEPCWPARCWLAGAEGQVSLDPGRADGQLLTFTQLRGRSRLSDERCWLTDMPVRLGPAGTPHAGYQVSWRADWLRDERVQAAALPRWWPERTVLHDPRDEVRLSLPDAAIQAAGITLLEDEEQTYLSAQPGVHLAQVHAGRGTTDVELAWADDLVHDHLLPATQRLLERDPRTLEGHEVFLLGRARQRGLLQDREVLAQAVESLAARPGPVEPLALAAVADHVLGEGGADLCDALPALAARVPAVPGALTCVLHATLASRLVGGPDSLPLPSGAGQPHEGPRRAVDEAIVRAEVLALRRLDQVPAEVVRVLALLGAGLPGRTVGAHVRALLWAVSGTFPEHWEVERWPVPLARVREDARARLLAERCDERALAWLAW